MINLQTESEQSINIFESIKHVDPQGNEFWYARELMPLLEYQRWESFDGLISRAIISLKAIYPQIEDHFREAPKMIKIAQGTIKETSREVKDYKLSRRACYLIAQNGDSSKEAIALAQNYFAQQTRKQELLEIKEHDIERILARRKLTESEKRFAGVMNERGIDGKGIAEIKSAGDEALFGRPTMEIKANLNINVNKPLADHLPTISIKAKDLATEMTTFKTQQQDLQGKFRIKNEHIDNNASVRKMLTQSGIYPERLPAEEDIKKLERKYSDKEIEQIEESKLLAMDVIEIDIRGIMNEVELQAIKEIIESNPGHSKLVVYYGSNSVTNIIERNIAITAKVIDLFRKYLVITED